MSRKHEPLGAHSVAKAFPQREVTQRLTKTALGQQLDALSIARPNGRKDARNVHGIRQHPERFGIMIIIVVGQRPRAQLAGCIQRA